MTLDALPRDPPSAGATSDDRRRRRRWKPWLAATAVTAVVVAVAIFVMNDQPLTQGSWEGVDAPGVHLVPESNVPAIGSPQPQVWQIQFQPGRVIRYAVSLRNDGPIGVTVTGVVKDDFPSAGMTRFDGLFLVRDPNVFSEQPSALVAFHPFSLGPHQERTMVIAVRMTDCSQVFANTGETIVSTPITFRLLGAPRRGSVDLGQGIRIEAPAVGSCSLHSG